MSACRRLGRRPARSRCRIRTGAFAKDNAGGTRSVKIGKKEVGKKNISSYSKSTGDEPATRSFDMGVVTHNITPAALHGPDHAQPLERRAGHRHEPGNHDSCLGLLCHATQCMDVFICEQVASETEQVAQMDGKAARTRERPTSFRKRNIAD